MMMLLSTIFKQRSMSQGGNHKQSEYTLHSLREKNDQLEGIIILFLSKGLKVPLKISMRESLGRYETPSSCPKGSR